MRLHVYRDTKKEWRWRLIARNGRIVACSGEGYTRLRSCERMALKVLHFGEVGLYYTRGQ